MQESRPDVLWRARGRVCLCGGLLLEQKTHWRHLLSFPSWPTPRSCLLTACPLLCLDRHGLWWSVAGDAAQGPVWPGEMQGRSRASGLCRGEGGAGPGSVSVAAPGRGGSVFHASAVAPSETGFGMMTACSPGHRTCFLSLPEQMTTGLVASSHTRVLPRRAGGSNLTGSHWAQVRV